MNLGTLLAGLLMFASVAVAQTPLKEYKVPDTKYTVSFPGDPKLTVTNIKVSDAQSLPEHEYQVIDNQLFSFSFTKYPKDAEKLDLSVAFNSQKASCQGGEGKGEIVDKYAVQGHPAIYFNLVCPATDKSPETAYAVVVVAVGNDVLQLMWAAEKGSFKTNEEFKAGSDRALAFLNSLKIAQGAPAPKPDPSKQHVR